MAPDALKAQFNLGCVLQAQGSFKKAEQILERVIEVEPESFEALMNLGIVFKDPGRLTDPKLTLGESIKLEPDYLEAHNEFGLTLLALDQPYKAIESFRKAITFDSEKF